MTSIYNDSPSTTSSNTRRSPRIRQEKEPKSILSANYLDRHGSKNDLVRRLRHVVEALDDDDVECNSPDYPGLAGLAAALVEDRYLLHRDKEVRLHTVLACMLIFYLYAPEPPWDESEILKIFHQLIRQLANLAVCTSPSQPNFSQYFRLLDQLAVVKTGVVLVEMTRTLDSRLSPAAALAKSEKVQKSKDDGDSADDSEEEEDDDDEEDTPSSEEALEVLADLIRTILQSVHIDHPADVALHAKSAISACIEEFDGTVPIPILDEILMCISKGPVIQVTNPAFVEATAALAASKKKGKKAALEQQKKKLPPRTVQQTNQAYMVAANVIRRTEDRISTPIASLLNGILNGETNVIEQTNISSADTSTITSKDVGVGGRGTVSASMPHAAPSSSSGDVWSIIYELHKNSPQILTTVIGTVATSLKSPNTEKRLRVTKLLGRLFCSRTSEIGIKFHACYREWIRRSSDVDSNIRLTMVKYLILVLTNKSREKILCDEATDALVQLITKDPSLDVRLAGVHQTCDVAHSQKSGSSDGGSSSSVGSLISCRLLKAVGNRVSSKNKNERRNSVTGLSHIFYRQCMLEQLKEVQAGGDDCDISVIINTLSECCNFETDFHVHSPSSKQNSYFEKDPDLDADSKYMFIPKLVFESACFTDSTDPNMRNRVIQIVDDVLLGSGSSSSKNNGSNKELLTPTAQAVGLAMILNSLEQNDGKVDGSSSNQNSNAFKWMCSLLFQRSKLQRALSDYVTARSAAERCPQGSEEKLTLNAAAFEKLEIVASLSAPLLSTSPSSSPAEDLQAVLTRVHTAKDRHIFRLLASISSPTHSPSARSRVFDELPKRTSRLGEAAASWTKCLARRTSMGNFMNVEIVTHCILLAQEAFREGELDVAMSFIKCVKIAVSIFPSLGGTKEGFTTLVELFGECRGSNSSEMKKAIDDSGIVTMLSGILAATTSAQVMKTKSGTNDGRDDDENEVEPDLQSDLIRLCVKDGTPEQARHAVFTLSALAKKEVNKDEDISQASAEKRVFVPLLKSLTSPSRMSVRINDTDNGKVVSVMTTLTAIVECAPSVFCDPVGNDGRSERAISFALESILLGRGDSDRCATNDEDVVSDLDEDLAISPSKQSRRESKGRRSIGMRKNGTVETELSLACRRACAAIDFLVTHIRSTILYSQTNKKDGEGIKTPSPEHIASIFNVLINLIEDTGLPPSSRDRQECKGSDERAALRETAALNIMRLCDARLKLESQNLTPRMWHILGSCFLDEEKSVRGNVMDELAMMLKGAGKYSGVAPSLRFLAYIALCPDHDHSVQSHPSVNGNAASVGRRSFHTKSAALQCISSLRRTCEATSVQCRAISREAERHFDQNLKMKLMPEFILPYAFHLLSFRGETPSGGGSEANSKEGDSNDSDSDDESIDRSMKEEMQNKVLTKRLKWLLEPLVQSLGEGADNISFLLRQTEMLGNKFCPVNISCTVSTPMAAPKSPKLTSPLSLGLSPIKPRHEDKLCDSLSLAKLKVICATARQVLLKFVKKDVNLTPYPGAIQIPSHLFSRVSQPTKLQSNAKDKSKEDDEESRSKKKINHNQRFKRSTIESSKKLTANVQKEKPAETRDDSSRGESEVNSTRMELDVDDSVDTPFTDDEEHVVHHSPKASDLGQLADENRQPDGLNIDMSPIPQSRSPVSTTISHDLKHLSKPKDANDINSNIKDSKKLSGVKRRIPTSEEIDSGDKDDDEVKPHDDNDDDVKSQSGSPRKKTKMGTGKDDKSFEKTVRKPASPSQKRSRPSTKLAKESESKSPRRSSKKKSSTPNQMKKKKGHQSDLSSTSKSNPTPNASSSKSSPGKKRSKPVLIKMNQTTEESSKYGKRKSVAESKKRSSKRTRVNQVKKALDHSSVDDLDFTDDDDEQHSRLKKNNPKQSQNKKTKKKDTTKSSPKAKSSIRRRSTRQKLT